MSEPNEPDDNVIRIRFRRTKEDLPTAPIKQVPRDYTRPFCTTHLFVYDKDARTVSCSRCERQFDPFEAFEHLAQNWAHYDYNHRNARGEIAELQNERAKIAKQVSNLKAQRRRLVPNVRQDVERLRSEFWRHEHEKNPTIAGAIKTTIWNRIDKILATLAKFGDEADAKKVEGAS